MRRIRSIAVSLATALLLAFMISAFMPGLANEVSASGNGNEIHVKEEYEFLAAVTDSSNSGKTIRLMDNMSFNEDVNVTVPITLDMNGHDIDLAFDCWIAIRMSDPSDIVTIRNGGCINGDNSSVLILVDTGKLIFESGSMKNVCQTSGRCFMDPENIVICTGTFHSFWSIEGDAMTPLCTVSYEDEGKLTLSSVSTYALVICGEPVTQFNYEDVLGDGVFSYDLWTRILDVNGDCNCNPDKLAINSHIDDLTISVNKPSKFNRGLNLYKDTVITGKHQLTIEDDYNTAAIMADKLTIKDISVDLTGKVGIKVYDNKKLDTYNAEIKINSTEEALNFSGSFDLGNCKIVDPEEYSISQGRIFKSDSTVAKKLHIMPPEYWGPVEYTWSEDNSTCTATRNCLIDEDKTETETVEAKITFENGATTYTVSFKNSDFNANVQTKTLSAFGDFVERLYVVALDRPSEPEGKAFWSEHVGNGDLTGAACANEFLLSKEFNDRGLNDEQFLTVLYSVFFDRKASEDPDGFNFWMNSLKVQGRDSVVDCFINSTEWCNVCATYGVKSGATRAKATIASAKAKAFATRLYTECLGRDPEEDGLKFWSLGLTNLELTGSQAAHEFFFCKEFNDHNFDNKELITRMYKTFMGREPDDAGMTFWLDSMSKGMTKQQLFDSFVNSPEFTQICQSYAIDRG